jgi:hypothetical protein
LNIGPSIVQWDIFFLLRAIQVALNVSFGPTNVGDGRGPHIVTLDASPLLLLLQVFFPFLGPATSLASLVCVMILLGVVPAASSTTTTAATLHG